MTTATVSVPERAEYLSRAHGARNVAHVIASHALLVGWFWAGASLLPFWLYAILSLPASIVHARAMSEWLHEGAHFNMIPDRRRNDALTDALVAIWFGTTTDGYRSTHFPHHAKAGFFVSEDPDTGFLQVSTRRELWSAIARDLCGITMLTQFLRFESARAERTRRVALLVASGLVHVALVAWLLWIGRIDAWVLYYLSLVIGYPLHNRLRVYGQHVSLDDDGRAVTVGSGASRTIEGGLLDKVLWTSPRLLFHYEHHRYPHLPWRALESLCDRSGDVNRYARSRWSVMQALYRGTPP